MSIANYVAISLPILVGFASLAIDSSIINYEKSNLQIAADFSALAAANYLDPEDNNLEVLHNEAVYIACENRDYDSLISPEQVHTIVGNFSNGIFESNSNGNFIKVTIENTVPSLFGAIFGNDRYFVSATAIAGKVSSSGEECQNVMDEDWPCLLFASHSLELTGNFSVDIDSSLNESSLCTNSREITLGGNLNIESGIDLHMGPGCEAESGLSCINSHGNSYNFYGDTTPMALELEIPLVTPPESYLNIPSAFRGPSGTTITTIQSGQTYFINSNFIMNSNQTLSVSNASEGCFNSNGDPEPAILYVNGDVRLGGGISGTLGHPECLEIRVMGEREIRINGRSDFYGSIYAPESSVYPNGNADFNGTIISKSIFANGNGDIILWSGGKDSSPHGSDEVSCEEIEAQDIQIRIVR
jgi:Putative Tad-like Flp pilus-assembly